MKFSSTALAIAMAGLAAAAPIAAHAQQQITGAGSTFGAPIYGKWGDAAKGTLGIALNYQAIGSGAGQNLIFNRTVDFGASDAPVPHDKLVSNHLVQFPTVMGAVDMIVNVPGVKTDEMKLTGEVVADIYLGKITKWNDKQIAALNPGLKLPAIAIAPVYRADGSGTTFVFTDYLSMLSPAWKSQVGSNTSVKWPAGSGAKGSDGVSGTVHNIRGGIGYVESAYATENKLVTTQMRNKAGKWVKPTMETFLAAASNANWGAVQDFAVDLNNEPGDASWPILSATFILLPTNPTNASQSLAVMKFFDWGFGKGDKLAQDLQYIVLPQAVKDTVRKAWTAQVKSGGASVYK
ncbi:MAG: phosphate ABC transporter substrate-binding protein PstS [Rhodospirillales bacterium]|nr:phosphate ABC transporter substrate-binding protein PstS [Rhodospirillales bacterium]